MDIISANESLLCPIGFFAAAAAAAVQHRPQQFPFEVQIGQARATASLEAICLAAIDDWQFVKISHGLAPVYADTLSHVRHGICGLCKCISLACLSRDDKTGQISLRFLQVEE